LPVPNLVSWRVIHLLLLRLSRVTLKCTTLARAFC
jgi:hypothetical protein